MKEIITRYFLIGGVVLSLLIQLINYLNFLEMSSHIQSFLEFHNIPPLINENYCE